MKELNRSPEAVMRIKLRSRTHSSCFNLALMMAWTLSTLHGCLPIDTEQPQCFPNEDCPRGQLCNAGRCIQPPLRTLKVHLDCLSGIACEDSLIAREVTQACLILEQPSLLLSQPIALERARSTEGVELSIPLFNGELRSSVILVTKLTSDEIDCDASEETILQRSWHRACEQDNHCLLRLRRSPLEISEMTTSIELGFSDDQGRCLERVWSGDEPEERCGGGDADCDGFLDEGIRCSDETTGTTGAE